jgi:hypothetical protein
VAGYCEHGIEPSGSINCWEVLEGLHNWHSFWIGKLSDKCIPIRTLLYISFKHILISLTSFTGTPNSVRILYNTSLLTEVYE